MLYETYSPEQTEELAFNIAKQSQPNDIYCLEGELGAGKTAFAKGFARGLNITEDITSPTFTIINEYDGFYHFDAYRIMSQDDFYDTGYEEYFDLGGVCLIEWASNIRALIPEYAVWINIKKDLQKGTDYRAIEIEGAKKC